MMSSATFVKKTWQGRPITQIIAVAVVLIPPYALVIWSHLSQRTITLKELFLFPLLLGGGCVVLALLVYRIICGERIASLNIKPGKWYTDLLVGPLLAVFFLGLFVLQQVIQSRWLPRTAGPPPEELIILFNGIVNDPLLLAVWLGPVAWLGVATFEELTRVLTFRLSHTLYCPGQWALDNVAKLRKEKIDTGTNTMADTVALALKMDRRRDHVPAEPFGLVSLHRYENIFRKDVFERIIHLLESVAREQRLLFILHPPTAKQLDRTGFRERLESNPQIELRPRYTYFDFVSLIETADFVITDGGSIQEESSYLGVPCLLMRKATERQEGLGENVVLSNYDPDVIEQFVRNAAHYRRPISDQQRRPTQVIVDHLASRGESTQASEVAGAVSLSR